MRIAPRATLFAVASLCSFLTVATSAEAQRPEDKSNSQFYLNRGTPGGPAGDSARQRARSGDCKGALPAFDAAIQLTIEPSLRRDRGLCHEKLEHVHPAIDDYRAYLHARPDAPDADDIRARLGRLEEAAGVGGPSKEQGGGGDDGYEKSSGGASASGSVSVGSSGARASSSSSSDSSKEARESVGKPTHNYDEFRKTEDRLDVAEDSPLRRGDGVVLGVYAGPRWFLGDGASSDTAFHLGGTLRYATSSALTIHLDLGYVQQGDANRPSGSGGFGSHLGFELRLPLNRTADQQILLGAGPGYERYTFSATRTANNVLLGRGKVGVRFVFGPSVALDVTFDPAVAIIFPDQSGATNRTNGILGGGAAFLVAF